MYLPAIGETLYKEAGQSALAAAHGSRPQRATSTSSTSARPPDSTPALDNKRGRLTGSHLISVQKTCLYVPYSDPVELDGTAHIGHARNRVVLIWTEVPSGSGLVRLPGSSSSSSRVTRRRRQSEQLDLGAVRTHTVDWRLTRLEKERVLKRVVGVCECGTRGEGQEGGEAFPSETTGWPPSAVSSGRAHLPSAAILIANIHRHPQGYSAGPRFQQTKHGEG